MAEAPSWLPELLTLPDFNGDSKLFIEAAYGKFHKDFIASRPKYLGLDVACRRDPIYDGKEAGFWHCTSEGRAESQRTPDLRRLERICWVRAIIENSNDELVDVWLNKRRGDQRRIFWYEEEFCVIIASRPFGATLPGYWQLITAYCTMEEHRKLKFRKERDAALKS